MSDAAAAYLLGGRALFLGAAAWAWLGGGRPMPRRKKRRTDPVPVPVAVRGILVAVVDVEAESPGVDRFAVRHYGLADLDPRAGDRERAAAALAKNWPGGPLDHETAYAVLWDGGE